MSMETRRGGAALSLEPKAFKERVKRLLADKPDPQPRVRAKTNAKYYQRSIKR